MPGNDNGHTKSPLSPVLTGPVQLTEDQLNPLWDRFLERVHGFVDFAKPGILKTNETDYKHKILNKYNSELGDQKLQEIINAGDGINALKNLKKVLASNIVHFLSWGKSFGETDESICEILRAFLDVSREPYKDSQTLVPIFTAISNHNLKPSWDTLSIVLWAMNPQEYFPIKISYYKNLALEQNIPFPKTAPSPESFDEVMNFGKAFQKALKPLNPSDWVDVQSFIWCVCPKSYGSPTRYWAGGTLWGEDNRRDDFIQNNYWQSGWGPDDAEPAAQKTWKNFKKIHVGDEIAMKELGGRHDLTIYYIGSVAEIDHDEGKLFLDKLDRRLYNGKGPTGAGAGNWFDTLVPVERQDIIDQIFKGKDPDNKESENTTEGIEMAHPLNQIIYGPPGTGKTYKTINYALSIIEGQPIETIDAQNRNKLQERYKQYKDAGQIEFITFHQNYAYEDFIQGLRPDVTGTAGSLCFKLNDGVFKQIADSALENYKASEKREESKPPFRKAFDSYFEGLIEGEVEHIEIQMKKASYKITEIGEKSIHLEKQSGKSNHTFSISTLSDMYEKEKYTLRQKGGLQGYYMPLLQELLNHAQSMSTDSDSEGLKNYVFIIDEINRANISRVFGELITLIEDDKRFGGSNEISAILPSGESFIVPPNLFIIGTMNTADKSIALIDIALRRRFDFIKLYPEVDLVEPSYRDLFNNINSQIVELKGPDFQIGHAYFMKKPGQEFTIDNVMNKRVIPLLYEYCMNDGDMVNSILTSANIQTVNRYGLWEFESYQNE